MKNIDTIIWDLDNTLYKFDAKMMEGWNYQATRYLIDNGFHMSFEETHNLVKKGWEEYGDSIHYFSRDYGYDKGEICKFIDSNLCTTYVTPCPFSFELFQNLGPYKHGILTMAPSTWAHRVLKHISLMDYFQNDHIIGAEQYDFEHKSKSPRGILLALDKIQSIANKTLFVEDTLGNLEMAKKHTDVQTVYLHHDRPHHKEDMPYVDIIVRDTPSLLKFIKEQN